MTLVQTAGLKQLGQSRVARAAGVPQGHLTYYFPKKIDLLVAVAGRFVESLVAEVGPDLAAILSQPDASLARRRLLELTARLLCDRQRSRTLLAFLVEADHEPVLKQALAENARLVAQLLAQALGREVADPVVQLAQAALWGAALQHLVFERDDAATRELVVTLDAYLNPAAGGS